MPILSNSQTVDEQIPLKHLLISLLIGSIFLSACQKEFDFMPPLIAESCPVQIDDPSGRFYSSDSLTPFLNSKKTCGLLPLNKKNYWVYRDSIFNNGVFTKVQYDTLRFVNTWQSHPDNLVWWETSISIGLPGLLYVTDSSFYEIQSSLFVPDMISAQKSFGLFAGDSIRYLTSFEDNAAFGRSIKLEGSINSPAGNFDDCILFEKNAPNYRRDKIYFKPGFGVVKYISEKAMPGSGTLQLQQSSILLGFHFE